MLQKSLHILMQVDASSCANLVLNGAAFFSARNLQKKKKLSQLSMPDVQVSCGRRLLLVFCTTLLSVCRRNLCLKVHEITVVRHESNLC